MMSYRLALFIGILICAFLAQAVYAQSESDLISQLRADYTAVSDAWVEFEQAENDSNTSSVELADYVDWIIQLNQQLAQSCRSLEALSSLAVPADIPCEEITSAYRAPAGIDINGETSDAETTAGMAGQFNASLGDFDEKLLREQDRVKARKAQTSSASGGGGGASGSAEGKSGQEGAEGSEGESGQEGAEGESSESSQSGQQSGQQGSESGSSNNQDNSSAGSPSAGRPSSAPPGTPDGRNDDVIARQLREAAEKETDPELKRKLWEEYRRYKQGK